MGILACKQILNVNISPPQLAICEIYTDPATKTYLDTFTKPVVPECHVDTCSRGQEEREEYNSKLVKFQSKVACILLDVNVHENSTKNVHIMQPPLTPEYVATLKELRQAERNLDYIEGDGNCLYRAISKILFGEQKYHSQVRTLLADFVEGNTWLFKNHFIGEAGTAYCKRIRKSGQWGSQIELIAVATILQVPVFLFSQQEEGSRKWIRYEPKSTADINLDFHPKLRYLREINTPKSFRMEICQSQNRSHFDRICPLNTHFTPEEPVPKQEDSFLCIV